MVADGAYVASWQRVHYAHAKIERIHKRSMEGLPMVPVAVSRIVEIHFPPP